MDIEDILSIIPDKQFRWKATTSLKWKRDMFLFFKDKNIVNALEIGTNQGWTSYLLSYFCNKVYTIENSEHNYSIAQQHCSSRSNINFILGNAYEDESYTTVPNSINLCVIDCIHTYDKVSKDINRSLEHRDVSSPFYLVFDDYSHPQSPGVRKAVDEFISKSSNVKSTHEVGHNKGHKVNRDNGTSFILNGPEGLILEYTNE